MPTERLELSRFPRRFSIDTKLGGASIVTHMLCPAMHLFRLLPNIDEKVVAGRRHSARPVFHDNLTGGSPKHERRFTKARGDHAHVATAGRCAVWMVDASLAAPSWRTGIARDNPCARDETHSDAGSATTGALKPSSGRSLHSPPLQAKLRADQASRGHKHAAIVALHQILWNRSRGAQPDKVQAAVPDAICDILGAICRLATFPQVRFLCFRSFFACSVLMSPSIPPRRISGAN